MTGRTGAEVIVGVLKDAGVDTVFGIPSIHNIRLYDALRRDAGIRHILCRQEASATHMADGYARQKNGLGVVIASTGPGTCYTTPGILEAWGSCSPVLLITTNIPLNKIGAGQGALHELDDQAAIFRNMTKAAFEVRSAGEIAGAMQEAVRAARTDRPGPVYVEVPTDLLRAEATPAGGHESADAPVSSVPAGLEDAVSRLRGARQPLLFAGLGAVRAGIGPEIQAIAECLGAPVVTTAGGKGIIPEDHPLAFGLAVRKDVSRDISAACDLVLAIGTRLREGDAKRRGLTLGELIHADWDERWIGKNYPASISLVGDLADTARRMAAALSDHAPSGGQGSWLKGLRTAWEKGLRSARNERPELNYLEAIRNALPRDGILVADNTQLAYWAEYFYPSYCSGGFVGARGSAVIGYALAAAMGARLASPDRPIVALIGDGGFLYGEQELATAVRHGIGFPVIVVNDNAYGIIAHLQRSYYESEHESRLVNPDFPALARAFGLGSETVRTPEALESAIRSSLDSGKMHLIELAVDFPDPPFGIY